MFFLSLANSLQLNIKTKDVKIAVIGAGPAGTSFAHHFDSESTNLQIDVFEKSDKIGGRVDSIAVPFNGGIKVDFGASIFVDSNPILVNASKKFNLKYLNESGTFGFYNGKEFVFESSPYGWLTKIRMLWRYGYSLKRGTDLGDQAAAKYKKIYELDSFDDIGKLLGDLDLWETLNTTARIALAGLSENFKNEIAEVTTLVNYGRDLDQSHALGCLVGILSDNSYTIDGGNSKIFESFLANSIANVHTKSAVKKISKNDSRYDLLVDGKWRYEYDYIVHAAGDFFLSGIEVDFQIKNIKKIDYYKIYITVVEGNINASYFGLKQVPDSIFCLRYSCEFTSVSKIRLGDKTHLYKVFTNQSIPDLTHRMFTDVKFEKIQQYYSYPKLHPNPEVQPIEIAKNLFYASSFEPILSTMETQSVSGMNLAKLIEKRIL
eukprot:NODE_91_length_21557_cov_0.766660.p5 type:complete len:433 gc:universal NODE_91_length_21557_cov_0.766660:16355-15057(-)